jgi:flagellar biosynthetic protein FliR
MELTFGKLLGFALILTRVSTFLMVLPLFSWKSIPDVIKISTSFLISFIFLTVCPIKIDTANISVLPAIFMMVNEFIYGLALGLIINLLFSVVRFGMEIAEREMGLNMAEALDPLTDEPAQPLSQIIELIFILLFLGANGHHTFIMTLSKSYETFPVGTTPSIPILLEGIIEAGSLMFVAGLRLAAPMLAASMILIIILAVLARLMPEMNILFLSFPIRIGLGLLMVSAFIPLIMGYLGELSNWMGKLLPI